MAKEKIGSFTRTALAVGSGIALGSLVDHYEITPETLESALLLAEKIVNSMQGILSLVGIIIAQGWSLHEKMAKSKKIEMLDTQVKNLKEQVPVTKKKEIKYND